MDSRVVNIKGLLKEDVLIALYDNVYKKSKASCHASVVIADLYYGNGKTAPPGTFMAPANDEARIMLEKNSYVEYVGPVMFRINFADDDTIDTQLYDKEHETDSTPRVKTARACIEQLREALIKRQEQAIALEMYRVSIHEKAMLAEAAGEKLREEADCLIKQIFPSVSCEFNTFLESEVRFKPAKSAESLQEYAKILTAAGLAVQIEKEFSRLGGTTTVPAKIVIKNPLQTIVEKMALYLSQIKEPRAAANLVS